MTKLAKSICNQSTPPKSSQRERERFKIEKEKREKCKERRGRMEGSPRKT